ncbi:uncharacterized protein FA14DRAFT_159567 [Meira miltonrushii]|uniref:Uncharacterized protein n=1 Tax=Meira miltonrushii TaxID=1280837 RepID=A0A316VJ53_9BASI|nr:uncharacterized protein FA14DRAFT_159567 [Meira miltonrushii]PWN37576.1 hypothetical protein FA14DRAFT_159567 [Meira miltonrushii]
MAGAMLLVSLLIIGRRMYERNFWIFRVIRVSSGPIIVPNPILSFGFIEGNFVIVFMALLIIALQYHEYHTLKPENLILWISLPWCITIFGAIFAAVGTHYATPTNQLPSSGKAVGDLSRRWKSLMKNAWVINGIAVALPAFICVTVAVPTFISNAIFQKANHLHTQWETKYADYTMFTQDMVTEAQVIWYTLLRSVLIASAVFCLWFVWASFCFIICTLLSLRLLRTISAELSRSNMFAPNFVVTQTRMIMSNRALKREERLTETQQKVSTPYKAQGRRKLPRGNHSYFLHSTNSFPAQVRTPGETFHNPQQSEDSLAAWNSNEIIWRDREQDPEDNLERTETLTGDVSLNKPTEAIQEEPVRVQGNRMAFIRRLIPNIVMTTEKAQSNAVETMVSSRDEQKRELRKAAIHIFTQYAIVGPGCATFGGIALMMGLVLHGSFEQPSNGGTKFEFFGALALLVVMYAVSFFGWVCAGAIFHRTYEPVFVNYTASTTVSSFGISDLSTTDSSKSKLQDFIRVGGADPKVRNKIRYPQAMVKSMLDNTPQEILALKGTNVNDISHQNNQLNNSHFHFHVPTMSPPIMQEGQHQPKRAIDRQYSNNELRKSENRYKSIKRDQQSHFDVEPEEGELVNNSVLVVRKGKNRQPVRRI